jgi:hypothetical protein
MWDCKKQCHKYEKRDGKDKQYIVVGRASFAFFQVVTKNKQKQRKTRRRCAVRRRVLWGE